MKTLAYGLAAGLTAAMLFAGPASAATSTTTTTTTRSHHASLDQYGCRTKASTGEYRCYRGAMAGQRFSSQAEMIDRMTGEQQRMMQVRTYRGERLVPVYVDDDGAPRPLPPHASRGNELPPVDADDASEITVW
jgi:hypothetical protein